MKHEQARAIQEGLRGAFGQWLLAHLKTTSSELLLDSISHIPSNQAEMTEREQNFGKIKALNELVDGIPDTVQQLVKNAEPDNK